MATKDIGNLRTRLSWEDDGANRSLEGFRRDLKGLRSEMNLARSGGRDYTNSLKGMRNQSDILSRTLRTQQERVKELKHRYDESVKAKGEDANQTKDLASQLNNATAQMNRTEQQLKNLNAEIKRQESPWTRLGNVMDETGERMQKFGRGMTDFGKSYSMRVTAPIVAGGVAAFKASMDYESAFAGVRKTVDATEEEFAELSAGIREMTKVLPASATEIAAVGEAAGQLGIKTENILDFTRVMIDLGEATNMTAESAATEFARFANIVGMSQKDFDRLGSVVVDLGNNLATTEAEIVEMAMRLAGAGAQIGLTEAEIMAFSASLSSVGIAAEAGGSAFSKVMVNMQLAAERGGDELKAFADVAGMSASDFKKAFEQDAASAMITFIEGLSTVEDRGMTAIGVLDEMGITETRMRDALLRAAGASDVFTDSIELGSKAWKENTALTEEAEQRYGTTESQLKIMWNRLKDVSITMGDALVPAVMSAIDAVEPLIKQVESGAKAFSEMDEEQQQTILKMIALVAAVGPASIALGGLTTTMGGVLRAGGRIATSLGSVSGAGLVGRLGLLGGPAGVAVLAAGGLSYLVYKLVDARAESERLHEVSTEVTDKLWDQATSLESLVDEYDGLRSKAKLSNDELGRMLDIQKDLEVTQNPKVVSELQSEYKLLAEKSGLTNEQLDKLLSLNNDIVEQSPSVEKSFTDKGNAVVESTGAVKDYIQSLKDMALIELEAERVKALENEAKLREDNKRIAEELLQKEQEIQDIIEMRNMPLEDIDARIQEINQKFSDGITTSEEQYELDRERASLLAVKRGTIIETLDELQKERNELIKQRDLNEEQIGQLDALNERYVEILLSEVDINYEKGEGLKKLDDTIDKLVSERDEILKNLTEEEKRNGIHNDYIEALDAAISKHTSIRDRINEETGYRADSAYEQKKANDLADRQLRLQENVTKQHAHNNSKIDEGTSKAKKQNEELGKRITKNVDIKSNPSISDFQTRLTATVSKRINLISGTGGVGRLPQPKYAKGTSYHPGGPFIAGEEGWELGRLGNRWEMLGFGQYDRPRGYEVFTHNESKQILNAMNNLPKYATGARASGAVNDAVNQFNNQAINASESIVILERIARAVESGQSILINGKEVARATANDMDSSLTDVSDRRAAAWGG